MTQPRRGFARRDALRLSYLEWGERSGAPSILLLHGGSANAHWWDFVAPRIVGEHLVAADLRGHGESDAAPGRDYSLDTHAGDIAALVEHLNLQRVLLVGHSFGAFVALAAVPALSARLVGLALVDSRGQVSERSARYLNTLAKFPHPIYRDHDDALRRFRLLPPATTATPEVLSHIARHSLVPRDDGTWTLGFDRAALSGVAVRDLQVEKQSVRCPALVIRGAHSTALSRSGLSALASELPNARCAEIENAHHHVMLDQPEALAACLAEFAREIATGVSPRLPSP